MQMVRSIGRIFPEPGRFGRLAVICALAAAGNALLMMLRHFLWVPLFVDTVFTIAVAFALGPLPAIAVALLTWVADGAIPIGTQPFHPFVIVAIVEALLVWRLRPISPWPSFRAQDPALPERRPVHAVLVSSQLLVLYVICVAVASIFGGAISYFYYTVWNRDMSYMFTAVNIFRRNFLLGGSPVFLADLLSRIQVNVVDRFIVIFGGYFVSLLITAFVRPKAGAQGIAAGG